jgi:dihydrofolate reductase
MPKIISFIHTTLDGYFADSKGDMSWAHKPPDDREWENFSSDNAKGGGTLLLGRITYDLMVSYWPTPAAQKASPDIAEQMNNLPKIVFSRTLDQATWKNTTLVKNNMTDEVRKLKEGSGKDMIILGSGSIVTQLANEGLIDEFQVVTNPIALGKGKKFLDGMTKKLDLKLTKSRIFANGNAFLCYVPVSR